MRAFLKTVHIRAVDSYNHSLKVHFWGSADTASSLLLDKSDGQVPLTFPNRKKITNNTRHMLPGKVAQGLGSFTAALRLADILIWLEGKKELREGVLVHQHQQGWVGHNEIMDKVQDICSFMNQFKKLNGVLQELSSRVSQESSASVGEKDVLTSLVNELTVIVRNKAALAVIKNIICIAFSVHVMMKGSWAVTQSSLEDLAGKGLKPKLPGLHHILLQAVAISPLVILLTQDITLKASCIEETILASLSTMMR
ncbi:hypothetical protein H1R20_g16052, partial [Candolleomyces eurysporus]